MRSMMADNVSHRPVENRLPRPPAKPHLITSDLEALAIAEKLAARFKIEASSRDRERRLPCDEIEEYTASGLGGITVPREFGGADVSLVTVAKVFEILSEADPSLGQLPQNQFGVLALLRDIGSESQKTRIFGDVLNGHRIGNAGPEKGSQVVTASTTRLSMVNGEPRLTGKRFYSTSAIFAHWIPTRAVDHDDNPVQVWLRRDQPGVKVVDDWSSFGQRTTASGSVVFDDAAVDPDLIFRMAEFKDRPGLAGPTSQLIQAAIDCGIAGAAISDAVSFVRDRARPWVDFGGERAADDPTIIHEIGNLYTSYHAAQEVLYEAAAALDEIARRPVSDRSSAEASVAVANAKILTTEVALEASEMLFDLAGSSATRAAHNLDRHWRNARTHTLHDPVRWKYHLVGNFELNDVLPKRHQWN
ncbi:SfnB family sulfur acquisition oxidoreductase [Rhizobium lentis]|uniref:SfnB family sulfur acquisition oxidoreductase n=2 Tax=Rhizobium lentis TaxID=1138194 RepID=A0A9Q3R2L0_9HYPH|nr:SfnB family sulfur acquisition oxidoreductase [Rhizobium lentis]MBX4958913.1 SfnB family sulfur acquisition oxidoreductase [Rhizobium lentis]MBX4977092.1 SfnB family sulfur acquisition oxidoreductase [Rhizobium lentis]MBX4988919.1 SfnB family sulfur acquisition oxidoreductase [Rhizobium lentis]MBX5007368.1 SfnB family sulfur acquisition oxidoreductase [Rhizobium lentis]MBX5013826.1 SfnB family sulfur acquisition oxidoreductase [Rhizobium lentis]